jgi:hypothetical protein
MADTIYGYWKNKELIVPIIKLRNPAETNILLLGNIKWKF